MNATTNKPTTTVSLTEGAYGTPRPEITLWLPKGTPERQIKAAAHALAAKVELATPAREGWCVEMDADRGVARVWLELIDADEAEVARGMKVLVEVAK